MAGRGCGDGPESWGKCGWKMCFGAHGTTPDEPDQEEERDLMDIPFLTSSTLPHPSVRLHLIDILLCLRRLIDDKHQ